MPAYEPEVPAGMGISPAPKRRGGPLTERCVNCNAVLYDGRDADSNLCADCFHRMQAWRRERNKRELTRE